MEDKNITCIDCSVSFLHSAAEQRFYAEKEFQTPRRCLNCRVAKKRRYAERENTSRYYSHYK